MKTITIKVIPRIKVIFTFLDWSVAEELVDGSVVGPEALVGGSVVGPEVTGAAMETRE